MSMTSGLCRSGVEQCSLVLITQRSQVQILPPLLAHGQGERVEGDHVLSVLRLAVRLDHSAIHHDPCGLGCECPGFEVEQIARVQFEMP
jgi:hypothetical protein